MAFDLDGYIDVAERISIFREKFPEGSLQPDCSGFIDVLKQLPEVKNERVGTVR